MSKVVLCMSADRGNAALLDSDWVTLERLVAPGVRVDVVESRCRYQGEVIAGRFRVTQTWVTPTADHSSWPSSTPAHPRSETRRSRRPGPSAPPHLGRRCSGYGRDLL